MRIIASLIFLCLGTAPVFAATYGSLTVKGKVTEITLYGAKYVDDALGDIVEVGPYRSNDANDPFLVAAGMPSWIFAESGRLYFYVDDLGVAGFSGCTGLLEKFCATSYATLSGVPLKEDFKINAYNPSDGFGIVADATSLTYEGDFGDGSGFLYNGISYFGSPLGLSIKVSYAVPLPASGLLATGMIACLGLMRSRQRRKIARRAV